MIQREHGSLSTLSEVLFLGARVTAQGRKNSVFVDPRSTRRELKESRRDLRDLRGSLKKSQSRIEQLEASLAKREAKIATLKKAIRNPLRSDEVRYAAYDEATLARKPFLNVGAGKFEHRHWTNVDFGSDWYAEHQASPFVHYDLMAQDRLPYDDGTIELIYSSHTVEHVTDAAVQNLLNEAHRVLRPGGGIRITCPDAGLFVRSMRLKAMDFWRWRRPWFAGEQSSAPSLEDVTIEDYIVREIATSRCRYYSEVNRALQPDEVREKFLELGADEFLDWIVRGVEFDSKHPGNHMNWWDDAKLTRFLRHAGFQEVYSSRMGQSLYPPMGNTGFFDSTKPLNSLYVEARR